MKQYKLLRDLPTFKAGDEFFISEEGNLIAGTPENPETIIVNDYDNTSDYYGECEMDLVAYSKETLERFPNVLTDWFEEIESFEIPDEFEMGFWTIMYGEDGFYTWHLPSDEFEEDYEEMLKQHIEVGWAFATAQEAEKHLEWMKARAVLIQDMKGFNPDQVNDYQIKYYVYYDSREQELHYSDQKRYKEAEISFETRESAKNSIKIHEKEWKIYLGVENE